MDVASTTLMVRKIFEDESEQDLQFCEVLTVSGEEFEEICAKRLRRDRRAGRAADTGLRNKKSPQAY